MADVDWMLHHGLIKAFDHENALRIVLNDYKALPDGTASESATAFCKRILSPLLQDLPAYKEVWHLTTEQKREIAELVKSVSLKNLRANVKDWQDEDPIPCMVEPYRMRDEIIFSRKTMQAGQAPSEPKLHDFLSLLQPHIDMIELDEQCAVAEQAIPSVDTLLEIKLQSSRADLESIRKHYMEAQALKSSARSEVIFDPSDLETEEMTLPPYLTPPLFPRVSSDEPPELQLHAKYLLETLQPITPPRQQPTALLPTAVLNDWEGVRPLRTPPQNLSPLTEQPSSSICMTEPTNLDHLKLEPMLFPRERQSGSTNLLEALRRSTHHDSDEAMDNGVHTAFDLLAQEYEPLLLPDADDAPMDFARAAGLSKLLDAETFDDENKMLGKLPIPKMPSDTPQPDVTMDDFINPNSALKLAKLRGNNLDFQLTWTPITFTEATDMNELLDTDEILPRQHATEVQSLIERLEQDVFMAQLLDSKPDEDLREALEVDDMVMHEQVPASPVLQASERASMLDAASLVDSDVLELPMSERKPQSARVPQPTSPHGSAREQIAEEEEEWASVITSSRAKPHAVDPGIKISNAVRLNAFMTARGKAILPVIQHADQSLSNSSSQVDHVSAESDARDDTVVRSPATTVPPEDQASFQPVRCLASLRLLQNTSLMSRLSSAGFELVEVDEESEEGGMITQPDLVLDSTTAVLFFKLLKLPGQEACLAESLQSFGNCYNDILLVFEMYMSGKEEKPLNLTPPLSKSLAVLKDYLSSLSCRLVVKYATCSAQAVDLSRDLVEERRKFLREGEYTSWDDRSWLSDQLSEDAAYLKQIQCVSNFGAQFLASVVGVDRLLAWTPVERSVRLAGEFGAKVEVINEVLAQSANSG